MYLLNALALPLVLVIVAYGPLNAFGLIAAHLLLGFALRASYLAVDDSTIIGGDWLTYQARDDLGAALFVLGFLLISLTFWLMEARRGAKAAYIRADLPYVNRRALFVLYGGAIIAWWLLFFGQLGLTGGATILMGRVSEQVAEMAHILFLTDIAVVASITLFYIDRVSGSVARETRLIVVLTSIVLFFLGGRGNLIQYLLTVLLIVSMTTDRSIYRMPMTYLVAVLSLGAFVSIYLLRILLQSGDIGPIESGIPGPGSFSAWALVGTISNSIPLLDSYYLAVDYAGRNGHDHGWNLVQNLVDLVPRAFWPEKPIALGLRIREEYYGDTLGGVPLGAAGEAFLAFGYLGTFFGGAILGMLAMQLTRILHRANDPKSVYPLLAAILVPILAFNAIRTGVDVSLARMTIYSFLAIGIFWFAKSRQTAWFR